MGNKGRSTRGFGGTIHHYDEHGKKVGRSEPRMFGGYTNYDSKGNKTGHSDPSFGGYSHSDGCYIATCVYGSYDCPDVWTLRRFRDYELGATVLGRAFIKAYYAISPTVVNLFGRSHTFKALCKPALNILVSKLQDKGIQNTPYHIVLSIR